MRIGGYIFVANLGEKLYMILFPALFKTVQADERQELCRIQYAELIRYQAALSCVRRFRTSLYYIASPWPHP